MGSSGGSSSAQREANRQEQQRQARVAATTAAINRAFDAPAREAQVADFINAAREYYTIDLQRQRAQDERQRKFAMSRTGLTGGSADVDLAKRAAEAFTRGTLEAEQRAQGSGAALRAQDQQARLNLIQMAQSGLDIGTAASQSASALRTGLQEAQATSRQNALSDVFGRFGDIYSESKRRQAERDAMKNQYSTLYQPSQSWAGQSMNWNQRVG